MSFQHPERKLFVAHIIMTLLFIILFVLFLFLATQRVFQLSVGSDFKRNEIVFFLLLFGMLLLGRWTSILVPAPLNPDESLMVAQAITFASKPIPWVHVDSATSGPINSYILMFTHLIGVSPGYIPSRLLAIVLMLGSLISVYWGLQTMIGRKWSGFVALMGALFWATNRTPNLLHYSSELVSVFLLSIGFSLVLRSIYHGKRSLLLGIFVMSLVPFAKMQGVAVAFPIVVFGILYLGLSKGSETLVKSIPAILLAGISLPLAIMIPVAFAGGMEDFYRSYLELALGYGKPFELSNLKPSFHFMNFGDIKVLFSLGVLCLMYSISIILLGYRNRVLSGFLREFGTRNTWTGMLVFVFLAFSFYAIVRPGTGFGHYWHLIVIPVMYLFGYLIWMLERMGVGSYRMPVIAIGLVSIFVESFPDIPALHALHQYRNWRAYPGYVVAAVSEFKQEGDELMVWGWEADIHVQTRLPAATRDVVSVHAIPHSEQVFTAIGLDPERKAYYQERFMSDLSKSMPAFLIDACAPGAFIFNNRMFGVESFAPLAHFINDNYIEWPGPEFEDGVGMRLWIRADRALALGAIEAHSNE